MIVDIIPVELPLDLFVAGLDSLSPHDDLTTVGTFERGLKHLLSGSHELAHFHADFADLVVVTDIVNFAITVKEDELQVLHLLEEIVHAEGCREVGIFLVLDLLRHAFLHPVSIDLLEEEADRVGLTEGVHRFKIASRYKQVDLHLKSVGSTDHSI